MKKKALLVTTVSGFIPQFEMNNVRILKEMGYEIHYASNYRMPSYGDDNRRLDGTEIIRHQIDFKRSPYNLKNIKAYRQLRKLMKEENFTLVHCHTPMGGVLGRVASHRVGTAATIYTAHGFHFYEGAPLRNWLIYYPVELFLARYTNQLLCINKEDYRRAKAFRAGCVDYVPGVGIDLKRIQAMIPDVIKKRREVGIPEEKVVLLSVGELIHRKNHEVVIRALAQIRDYRLCYVICGHGELKEYLEKLAKKLGVRDQVIFLGYREDVIELYCLADIFILPSLQEGLSVALMEAMVCGLPTVCSDIRGNRDLIGNKNGILVEKNNQDAYGQAVRYLLENKSAAKDMGKQSLKIIKKYDINVVSQKMKAIYSRIDMEKIGKPDREKIENENNKRLL